MKKVERSKIVRLSRRREKRRLNSLKRRCNRRLGFVAKGLPLFFAPDRLCLTTHFDELTRLVTKLRSSAEKGFVLSFSRTVKAVADGTLFLHSELDRLSLIRRKIRFRQSRNQIVNHVLTHLGVLQTSSKYVSRRADIVGWHTGRGTDVDSEAANKPGESLWSRFPRTVRSRVIGAMNEALSNVKWAYNSELLNSGWRTYWRSETNAVCFAIADRGVGIPKSLPKTMPEIFADVGRKIIGGVRDAELISAALTSNRTASDEAHRGKGLPEMAALLEQWPNAQMTIYSNCGKVLIQRKLGKTTETKTNSRNSILGTLVIWKIETGN